MSSYLDYYNGDKNQLIVQTPYGQGLVVRTRPKRDNSSMKEIRLLEWQSSQSQTKNGLEKKRVPMLYTTIDYESVTIKKGDDVITPYGRGVVLETVIVKMRKKSKNVHKDVIDDDDNNTGSDVNDAPATVTVTVQEDIRFKYHVLLNSWRLAGRSRVKCYLFSNQVKVVRTKTLSEMDPNERIDYAKKQKQIANKSFVQKNYNTALHLYAEAVDAVRYIQHTPNNSNECRADLLVVIVTCSNNAATCCIQLQKYEEAQRFAKNALILLNALFDKQGMKIHAVLLKDHKLTDARLFGEWRGKSGLIIAKTLAKKEMYDEAIECVRHAKEYIMAYITPNGDEKEKELKRMLKEIVKLQKTVIEYRKVIRQKERARAKKMFASEEAQNDNASAKNQASENYPSGQSSNMKADDKNNPKRNGSIKEVSTAKAESPKDSGGNSDSDKQEPVKLVKRVSFAEELEERHILEDSDFEDDEEEPWYEEHKEAIVLLALSGLAFLAFGLRGARQT